VARSPLLAGGSLLSPYEHGWYDILFGPHGLWLYFGILLIRYRCWDPTCHTRGGWKVFKRQDSFKVSIRLEYGTLNGGKVMNGQSCQFWCSCRVVWARYYASKFSPYSRSYRSQTMYQSIKSKSWVSKRILVLSERYASRRQILTEFSSIFNTENVDSNSIRTFRHPHIIRILSRHMHASRYRNYLHNFLQEFSPPMSFIVFQCCCCCCKVREVFAIDVGHIVGPMNYSRCDTKHRLPFTITLFYLCYNGTSKL